LKETIVKWKKVVPWILTAAIVAIVGLAVTALLVVKRSSSFRQDLLTKVEQSIYQSTGARVTVRDFNLGIFPLHIDLYGVVVHGSEAQSSQPLLQCQEVSAGIKLDSLLGRKWSLRDVEIDHPIAYLFVNQAGESNMPRPENNGRGATKPMDMNIRELLLRDGEIYYNDKKVPLDAELHKLQLNAGFDNILRRYHGVLSYADGRVRYGHYAPVSHNLDLTFVATPARFTVESLAMVAGKSRVVVTGSVEDYNNPAVQATYDAQLATSDVAPMLRNVSKAAGMLHMTGQVHYRRDAGRSQWESISLNGNLTSSALAVTTPGLRAEVREVGANYKLAGGNAEIENIHAQVLGGRFSGRLSIHDLAKTAKAKLQARLTGVSLEQLQAAVRQPSPLQDAHLSGSINADTQATWNRALQELVAHGNVTLQGALGQNSSTPLGVAVHADYASKSQRIALHQSYIRTPQTSITVEGQVSQASQLQVSLRSGDLHELELLAESLMPPSSGQPVQRLDLYGTGLFKGSVTGSAKAPQVKGEVEAHNLRAKRTSWRVLRTNIDVSPSLLSFSNGDLEAATQGSIHFNVQAKVNHWAYTSSSPIHVEISASQISVADLQQLAGQSYPVSGALTLNASIHGSWLNPVGHGNVSVLNAKVFNETIQSLALKFQGNGEAVSARMVARLRAGDANAEITLHPKTRQYEAQLQVNNIRLERLQVVKERKLPIAGGLKLDASGKGTLDSPELTATVKVPDLQIDKQTVSGLTLGASVHNQLATIELDSEVGQTSVKGRGTVGIKAPYAADIHLDTGRLSLRPFLALYAPAIPHDFEGQTELHASIRGPLVDEAHVEAHLDVPVFIASYQQLQLSAAKPVQLDYQNGIAMLAPTSIQGTGTDIRLQARIPVNNVAASTFLVQGTVDLRVAQLLQPGLQSNGQIQFDLDSRKYAGSNLNGQVRIVNGGIHAADMPVGLDNVNGTLTITKTRLEVSNFQAQVGGGAVTLKGGIAYSPTVRFDLASTASNVRVRYPEGLRAILDSNLVFIGTRQSPTLSGQVKVQRVSFTPDFDLARFISQFGEGEASAPQTRFEQDVRLNIGVQSTSQMELESSKVSLRGTTDLRIVGTVAQPVVLGRANLNGGDLFFAGNRYVVQSGVVEFLNPSRTEPVVNLQVQTKIDQYEIALNIQGPIAHLRTSYTSDPALPPVDIINLLAFGKTTEAAGANPTGTGSLGAQSVLAQGISNAVSGRVEKLAGLSHVAIDPALGGNSQNPGPRIAIQQRVTGNLFVTFATGVTSTQNQGFEVQYRFNPRWSVSGVRDQNGGVGMDARYHKRF
jgi:translocation and assembly module TamB